MTTSLFKRSRLGAFYRSPLGARGRLDRRYYILFANGDEAYRGNDALWLSDRQAFLEAFNAIEGPKPLIMLFDIGINVQLETYTVSTLLPGTGEPAIENRWMRIVADLAAAADMQTLVSVWWENAGLYLGDGDKWAEDLPLLNGLAEATTISVIDVQGGGSITGGNSPLPNVRIMNGLKTTPNGWDLVENKLITRLLTITQGGGAGAGIGGTLEFLQSMGYIDRLGQRIPSEIEHYKISWPGRGEVALYRNRMADSMNFSTFPSQIQLGAVPFTQGEFINRAGSYVPIGELISLLPQSTNTKRYTEDLLSDIRIEDGPYTNSFRYLDLLKQLLERDF